MPSDESLDNEEDNELALEYYKHFLNSWVDQIFDKGKQTRNYHESNCSYRTIPSCIYEPFAELRLLKILFYRMQ